MIKDGDTKVTANDYAKTVIMTGAERFARAFQDIEVFANDLPAMTEKELDNVKSMVNNQLNRVVKLLFPGSDPIEL
jgi:hypothetical protein